MFGDTIFQMQRADHLRREALGIGEEVGAGAIVGVTKAKLLEGSSSAVLLVSLCYCTHMMVALREDEPCKWIY